MTTPEIRLPRKLTNRLLHLAQISPEAEICGLIGANADGQPATCYPIANSADTPQNRFLLDASQQIAAMKQMRERGENLFAIYHSHPHTPALPSTSDVEQAAYPQALHLIISLDTKGVLELRGFQIQDRRINECVIELIEG